MKTAQKIALIDSNLFNGKNYVNKSIHGMTTHVSCAVNTAADSPLTTSNPGRSTATCGMTPPISLPSAKSVTANFITCTAMTPGWKILKTIWNHNL